MQDRVEVGGDVMTFRVTSEQSDGALIAYEVEIAPGGGPPVLHRHEAFEMFRVEAGELTFFLASAGEEVTRTVAGAGETVAIPGGSEHTVRNLSPRPARALAILSPGAAMERFARAAGRLDPDRTSLEDVLELARANGVEITRPLAEPA